MKPYSIELLQRWAFTDDLTGLSNFRHLGLVEQERHEAGATTYYVAIDLDGFKRAQDQPGRGHPWGDRLLRRFARFLLQNTRQLDQPADRRGGRHKARRSAAERDIVLGRPGGDEFLVLVPSEVGAEVIAARVRAWGALGVTASAGVGRTRKAADRALYRAKAGRRVA
jgi:GGDEF domain-containing protein